MRGRKDLKQVETLETAVLAVVEVAEAEVAVGRLKDAVAVVETVMIEEDVIEMDIGTTVVEEEGQQVEIEREVEVAVADQQKEVQKT